jgi:hypothetical protein
MMFGACHIPLEKNSRPFQRYISHPQIPKVSVAKPKYQICTCLTTVDQAGKKKPQPILVAVFF